MGFAKRVVIAIYILNIAFSFAQDRFSGENAYQYIEALCRPEFGGRKTGQPDCRESAIWIGEQFKKWGLEPGGGNGTFLQDFPMLVTTQMKTSILELKNGLFGPIKYQEGNDFVVYFNSGSNTIETEVIFAGFGISEPEKGWDDYAGIDVAGKIVLVYRGTPDGKEEIMGEYDRNYRNRTAGEKGAAGILVMSSREAPVLGVTIREKGYQPKLASAAVSKKLARDIFQGTMKNMSHVLADLKKSPQSFATGKIMKMMADVRHDKQGVGENAIGILPGSDPVLKNEYIVVGGHMDHNGTLPSGHLYPGADDNASGTAVVMELARALSRRKTPLRRSVVFAGFGAEEQGLLGSLHFADQPTIPLDQICAMFNFDMEGNGNGGGSVGGRNYFPALVDDALSDLSELDRKKLRLGRGWGFGGSDHAPFIQQGIPAMGFHSTGRHPFYHRVEDKVELINRESLQFVGDRAYELIVALGDHPQSLLYDGLHQGRCFTLFGDQVDLSMSPCRKKQLKSDPLTLINSLAEFGLRYMVMDLSTWSTEGDLLSAFYEGDKWISSTKNVIRYSGTRSLTRTVSGGSMAVGFGLKGTEPLKENERVLSQLCQLGLDVLQISDVDDPIFNGASLSEWGQIVLQTLQKEKVLLSIQLKDHRLIRALLEDYRGKTLLHMSSEAAVMAADAHGLSETDKVIWMIQCGAKANAAQLSDLMNKELNKVLHFYPEKLCDSSEGEQSCRPASANSFHALIQRLYELRVKAGDNASAYDEMVQVLGGNLKKMF